MKAVLLFFIYITFLNLGRAQKYINYQAVIKDNLNKPIEDQVISIIVSIYYDSTLSADKLIYQERFNNVLIKGGLLNLKIGGGERVPFGPLFESIAWDVYNPFYIKLDYPTLGIIGKPQILTTVPYALSSISDWKRKNDSIVYTENKKIGINTNNPGSTLHLEGPDPDFILQFSDKPEANSAEIRFTDTQDTIKALLYWNRVTNDLRMAYDVNRSGEGRFIISGNGRINFTMLNNGNVGIGTSNPTTMLDVRGWTKTEVLEITGGSDIAEMFFSNDSLEPGDVVSIDPDNNNLIQKTQKPYDKNVIGVISGAGGINSGLKLSQTGTLDGHFPVAIAGRVKVKVKSQVNIGDLLVSSEIRGYAMPVEKRFKKAVGSIIGKVIGYSKVENMALILITNH